VELQSHLEVQRQRQLLEQFRADELASTKVAAEQLVAKAEGESSSIRLLADAKLYEEQKKAEGVQAMLLAHSSGISSIIDACNGDTSTARFYLGLKEGLYEKLAREQAAAVKGLNPKISVWNTGSNANESDPIAPILKTVQSLAPMLDGLHQHTDFKAPKWVVETKDNDK
jgi:flotillin